jgi:transcriptional regulator with XRE-family HTH domain
MTTLSLADYAVLFINMQQLSEKLCNFITTRGLSQEELASEAGVSQSTVSRALRRFPERHSQAVIKLCNYAGIELKNDMGSTAIGTKQVLKAFEEIWDGSDAHATAIARIIEASRGLIPERR